MQTGIGSILTQDQRKINLIGFLGALGGLGG
jgi:hypothetical protein